MVVETGHADPETYHDLVEKMDRTGKVNGVYQEIMEGRPFALQMTPQKLPRIRPQLTRQALGRAAEQNLAALVPALRT